MHYIIIQQHAPLNPLNLAHSTKNTHTQLIFSFFTEQQETITYTHPTHKAKKNTIDVPRRFYNDAKRRIVKKNAGTSKEVAVSGQMPQQTESKSSFPASNFMADWNRDQQRLRSFFVPRIYSFNSYFFKKT